MGGPNGAAGGGAVSVACDAITPWSARYGSLDVDGVDAIAVDHAQNVVAMGYFTGSVDFGGGKLSGSSQPTFVAKWNAAGAPMWSRSFAGDAAGYIAANPSSLAVSAADDVVIAATAVGSVDLGGGVLQCVLSQCGFLAKLDATGAHVFSKGFPGMTTIQSLVVRPTGEILITGSGTTLLDFGGGPLLNVAGDTFLAEFDASGNFLWATTTAAPPYPAQGPIFPAALALDPTGGFFYAGGLGNDSPWAYLFLAKYDDTGLLSYVKSWTTPNLYIVGVTGLVVDALGNPTLLGTFGTNGSSLTLDLGGVSIHAPSLAENGPFLAAFDASGLVKWAYAFGPDGGQAGSLAVDSQKNLVVANLAWGVDKVIVGGTSLQVGLRGDYVARFDSLGNPLSLKGWADGSSDKWLESTPHVAVDGCDHILLGGTFLPPADFGQGPLQSAGKTDIFVTNLGP